MALKSYLIQLKNIYIGFPYTKYNVLKMKFSLLSKIKNTSIKDMFSVASVFSSVTGNLVVGNECNVSANPEHAEWEGEKEDILERANWLCSKIVVSAPETLINEAPSMIGREYQGEWAI